MTTSASSSTVLVVGLGNPLMADDGFGEAVVDALHRDGLPRGMAADTAPDVHGLWSLWRGQGAVWLVDSVAAGGRPGVLYRFDHQQILKLPSTEESAHHLSLASNLQWLLHANEGFRRVRFRLWGVEPATVSARSSLSGPVAAVVAQVANEILGLTRSPTANTDWIEHREVS